MCASYVVTIHFRIQLPDNISFKKFENITQKLSKCVVTYVSMCGQTENFPFFVHVLRFLLYTCIFSALYFREKCKS